MKIASISIQGSREHMEDRHFIDSDFNSNGWIFAGIYDGHGGHKGAEYAKQNLHLCFQSFLEHKSPQETFVTTYDLISKWMTPLDGGTCSANLFIKDNEVFYANVGDSRIIVVGKEILQLSTDHVVTNPEEAQRIKEAGGLIRGPYVFLNYQGLMVTRSLGDRQFEKAGVINIPAVGVYKLLPTDKYIVMASDGLFTKVSNEEVALITRKGGDVNKIAEKLRDKAIKSQSKDNITIIILEVK